MGRRRNYAAHIAFLLPSLARGPAAGELTEFGRARESHAPVGVPTNFEAPAAHIDAPRLARVVPACLSESGNHGSRTGSAREGLPHPSLENPHGDVSLAVDLHKLNVRAVFGLGLKLGAFGEVKHV